MTKPTAHEGKVHHRIANYNKIKVSTSLILLFLTLMTGQNELAVDDYLPSDDPRVMAEGWFLSKDNKI